MKVTCTNNNYAELTETSDILRIEAGIYGEKIEATINKSKVMHEWYIATPPAIFKSIHSPKIMLFNQISVDLSEKVWNSVHYPNIKTPYSDAFIERLATMANVDMSQSKEICDILNIENLGQMKIATLNERLKSIPLSTNVAFWRYFKTSEHLIREVLWQMLPWYLKRMPDERKIQYNLRTFYRRHTEYGGTDAKIRSIKQKVILPFQCPKSLENVRGLCLTATPQSEKAGKIAEIAIGTKIDQATGKITEAPAINYSLASIQNPYPTRTLANRQVVMCAITQAMNLVNRDIPIVRNEQNQQPIDTLNILTARMNHPLTAEDGAIISYSTALRMKCFKRIIERFNVSKEFVVTLESLGSPEHLLIKTYESTMKTDMPFVKKGKIGHFIKKDGTIKSLMSKYPGICTNIERKSIDGKKDLLIIETFRVIMPEIGSKIIDRISNKGTISKIVPDIAMPYAKIPGTNTMQRIQMIVGPYLGKRNIPSREMEEIISLRAKKINKQIITKGNETLEEIRKQGTNISPCLWNIDPGTHEPMLAMNIPIGNVAYAVLDHNPREVLKYSNELKTTWNKRTKRGYGNFNFTEALGPMKSSNAIALISEIQDYATSSDNMHILEQNGKTIGVDFRERPIINDGIFKQHMDITPLINKWATPEQAENREADTIFDEKYENTDIQIEIPEGISVYVKELIHSRSHKTSTVLHYINSEKGTKYLESRGIPINHVTNNGKQCYITIPGSFIHTWVDNCGHLYFSKVMSLINDLLIKMKVNGRKSSEEENAANLDAINLIFNRIIEFILNDTIRKKGILREVLSPRIPYSIYAVASNSGEDCNVAFVPMKALLKFSEKEEFRKSYGIPDNFTPNDMYRAFDGSQGHRILVMRQPCHRRNEVSSYIIKVWKNNTIGLSAAAMSLKSGDFDGRQIA